ncbi:hypothetical protein ACHAWC_008544 [Mediolabrus comicus]
MMTRHSSYLLIGVAALASASFNPKVATAFFSPPTSSTINRVTKTQFATPNTSSSLNRSSPSTSSLYSSLSNTNDNDVLGKISAELTELVECTSLVFNYLSKPENQVSVQDVLLACDAVDAASSSSTTTPASNNDDNDDTATKQQQHESYLNQYLSLRQKSHEFDYNAYVKTAEFLSPSRIPRGELPNVQDVTYVVPTTVSSEEESAEATTASAAAVSTEKGEQPLVADCTLENISYNDSPLDKLLLSIFRNLVETHTGGIRSDIPGIKGLLAQGRQYMTMELPDNVTYADHTRAQHTMVKNTLGGLMTPVLPPFYRIFMSGIVPKLGTEYDGKQFGPWFYAPWLTTLVTPIFFGFLVGPSKPNRRSDGQRGGLVVEKCKFLQESGCKGLCLHQCKIPAQEFFKEELGLDLTVRPNFVTQECSWSFGEVPVSVEDDDSFPKGCLVGCESRKIMAERKSTDVLCM